MNKRRKKKDKMENDMINVAEILEKFPKGTILWSNVHGCCTLIDASERDGDAIAVEYFRIGVGEKRIATFSKFGEYQPHSGLCNIFPSYWMQDWEKLTWKKGDILVQNDYHCIFEEFAGQNFCSFKQKYIDYKGAKDIQTTANWSKSNDENANTRYIRTIEEEYGGKLNLETLEIEKPEQEFKDGDILTIEDYGYKSTVIYKCKDECIFRCYAAIDDVYNQLGIDKRVNTLGRYVHLATDSEKQQLYAALEKDGKTWDAEKNEIVDLPNKFEFKPFDKVLVRDVDGTFWKAGLFSDYNSSLSYPYSCIGSAYRQCIPYNDKTKHLLGTKEDWKGGNV